jgi:hypothetical protein
MFTYKYKTATYTVCYWFSSYSKSNLLIIATGPCIANQLRDVNTIGKTLMSMPVVPKYFTPERASKKSVIKGKGYYPNM